MHGERVYKIGIGECQLDRWHCASEISGTVTLDFYYLLQIQLSDSTSIIGRIRNKTPYLVPL